MIRPEVWPWEIDAASGGCQIDPVAHHPYQARPDVVTGELTVDPDIVLKARGFDLQISFFYNSKMTVATAWGNRRSASIHGQLKYSSNTAFIIRGDAKVFKFTGSVSPGVPSTLAPSDQQFSGTQLDWDGTQFVETFPDGKTITYGHALSTPGYYGTSTVEDPSGNIQTYTYGGDLLESITVPEGQRVTLLYNNDDLVETIQDWAGRRWTMTYDNQMNLETYQVPSGCMTQYEYESGAPYNLKAITDPRGYTTSYTWTGDNQVQTMALGPAVWTYTYSSGFGSWGGSEIMSPTGAITTFLLDTQVRLGAKVMPEGYRVTYSYDGNNAIVQEEMPYGLVRNVTLNSFNQPLTSADPLGNVTSFGYDASNNLVSIMNALGEVTTMTYDGQRRMTSQMDPLGRVTTNVWNGNGTLQAMVDGRGLRTTFAYDTVGNLVSTLYSDGSVATYTYDTLGRRIAAMDPLGRVTTTSYDAADHVVSVMNAAGEVSTFIYDTCLLQAEVNPLGYRTSYTYERYGKVRTVMNALGQVTTNSYDNMGYPVTIQNALGYVTTLTYNAAKQRLSVQDANGNRVTTSYDAGGRPVSFINGEGIVTTTIYDARGPIGSQDALGRVTTMVMDALGRRIATQSPMGFRTSTIYDAAGQVKATQDALGYLTTNSYDAAGNLVTMMDARGYVSTQIYETTSNRLRASQDATGARTSYSYDVAGQTLSVQNARGFRTTYSYDQVGRTKDVQDALNYRTTYAYDVAGQQIGVRNARGYRFTTIYDPVGRSVASQSALNIRTTQVYDAAGQTIASVDGDGYRWSTIYDPGGRVIASQTPLNHRTTTTYDKADRPVEVQNPRGYVNTTTYDLASRVTAQTNPLGHQRQFGYDLDGRNVTIANAIGGIITMAYDNAGQMLAIGNELNQRTSYTYDPTGNTATRQFANGDRTTYTYDPVGREATRRYADDTRVTLTYDATGNMTAALSWMGTATMTYDALDQKKLEVDESNRQLASTYNQIGERTFLVMSDLVSNNEYSWGYDADGRVIQVNDPAKNTIDAAYNKRGLRTTMDYAGGRKQGFTYDIDGRNTGIEDVAGSQIQKFIYQFDANGNRIVSDDAAGSLSTYSYDPVDRLTTDNTSGTGAHSYAYSYDSRGNILTNNETGATLTNTYDAASRLTTSIEGSDITTYTYDLNGNLTAAEKGASAGYMLYSPENQMGYYEDETADGTYYLYDPFARMKSSIYFAGLNYAYTWDDDLIIRQDDSAGLRRSFTQVDGQIVGEVTDLTGTPTTKSYLEDFLGSVTGEVSTSNVVSNSRRFTPYGRDWLGVASVPHSPSWIGGHGYHPTGLKWADYSVFHRIVTPETGQWTTRDLLWPEELAYGYVNGNPTTRIDPSGLSQLFPPSKPKPGRPGPAIPKFGSCKDMEQYVSHYCAWCARNPSNDCKWECDRLARKYKQDCNKVQLTPGKYKPGWDVRIPIPKGLPGPPCEYCQDGPYFVNVNSIDEFGYANWCGLHRGPNAHCKSPKPIDASDSCCMSHDLNLGNYKLHGPDGCAHCLMVSCLQKANCATSPTPSECEQARKKMLRAFCALCAVERSTKIKCNAISIGNCWF